MVYCIINTRFECFTNYVVICAVLVDLKSASGVLVTRATGVRSEGIHYVNWRAIKFCTLQLPYSPTARSLNAKSPVLYRDLNSAVEIDISGLA